MSFKCPQCKTQDSLEITTSIELPSDRRSDEISLQVVGCSACKFRGLAVYEESRRGVLESESWNHIGYWVSPDAIESILMVIQSCPDRHNPQCRCLAHSSLGQKDVYGMWSGLLELERGHTFALRLAS
jgi:Zn ribbon nucleic-acid-binding protein